MFTSGTHHPETWAEMKPEPAFLHKAFNYLDFPSNAWSNCILRGTLFIHLRLTFHNTFWDQLSTLQKMLTYKTKTKSWWHIITQHWWGWSRCGTIEDRNYMLLLVQKIKATREAWFLPNWKLPPELWLANLQLASSSSKQGRFCSCFCGLPDDMLQPSA